MEPPAVSSSERITTLKNSKYKNPCSGYAGTCCTEHRLWHDAAYVWGKDFRGATHKEHRTLRELLGTVLLCEHLLALLSLKLCFRQLLIPRKNAQENSLAKVTVVFDFHPYEPVDLDPDEFRFSRSFVRCGSPKHVLYFSNIAHGCCELRTYPIVAWYEAVHSIYTKKSGIQISLFLEINAKI